MTLGDSIAMVAGVGLGLGTVPPLGGWAASTPTAAVALVLTIITGLWVLAVAIAAVVLARSARHRRRPRPAEWLAILIAVAGLAFRPAAGLDRAVAALFAGLRTADVSFAALRWLLALAATAAIVAGLVGLRLTRRILPAWAKTVVLAGLAFVALWGPIEVIGLNGPDLLTPSTGFGAGDGWTLYRGACLLAAQLPMGLVFGLPLIAAFAERLRRPAWTWTEWASLGLSSAVALAISTLYRGEFRQPSVAWATERFLGVLWLLAIGLISRLILVRLGPGWRRWLDGPGERREAADPPAGG